MRLLASIDDRKWRSVSHSPSNLWAFLFDSYAYLDILTISAPYFMNIIPPNGLLFSCHLVFCCSNCAVWRRPPKKFVKVRNCLVSWRYVYFAFRSLFTMQMWPTDGPTAMFVCFSGAGARWNTNSFVNEGVCRAVVLRRSNSWRSVAPGCT